ncbi:MAG: potassium channel family protein [Bacteroidales bacterium]|nr:potassium channel family protein [Bacteroidales bacterium]
MFLLRNMIMFLKKKVYRQLTISSILVLINGTVVFHFVEKLSWVDSFYFSVITLTTVGYGDIAPQTTFGKIFTAAYVLTGIGIIFGFINAFSQHRIENMERFENRRKNSN